MYTIGEEQTFNITVNGSTPGASLVFQAG